MKPEEHKKPETLHVDLRKPEGWAKQLREMIEPMSASEAEDWMGEFRIVMTLAGRIVRDQVYERRQGKCFVCGRTLKDGKPAGGAGYYDADRTYINVYYCDQSETTKAYEMVKAKEDAVEESAQRADKAARQAAVDARTRVSAH